MSPGSGLCDMQVLLALHLGVARLAEAVARARVWMVGSAAKATQKAEDKERKRAEQRRQREAYHGYNQAMIEKFTIMGFPLDQVVAAFEYIGIDKNDGEEYELEEEYIGDVTARLFGET